MSSREGGVDKGYAEQSSRSRLRTSAHSTSRSASSPLLPSSSSNSFSVSSKGSLSGSPSRSLSKSGSHKSPYLSVSLEKKPQSSQRNVHQNVSSTSLKGKPEHPTSPSSRYPLFESSELKDGCTSVKLKVDNELGGQYLEHNTHETRFSTMVGYKENSAALIYQSLLLLQRTAFSRELLGKPKMQISVGCDGKKLTQEMILALKHYGLPALEEGGSYISKGIFAARSWPCEMIYYR